MDSTLVMTIVGPDRPGLVEAVARLVGEHGGNWLESRMSRLGGQFAGILRVQVPEARQDALKEAMQNLRSSGLDAIITSDKVPAAKPSRLFQLTLVGHDRPGIVRSISGALAEHGINVEELETECTSAAMTGETLFNARATLAVPTEADTSAVRKTLEKIAEDLIVEISLADLQPATNRR